jgi:hypothetical protein
VWGFWAQHWALDDARSRNGIRNATETPATLPSRGPIMKRGRRLPEPFTRGAVARCGAGPKTTRSASPNSPIPRRGIIARMGTRSSLLRRQLPRMRPGQYKRHFVNQAAAERAP